MTLELERNTLSVDPHEPLVLAETGSPAEYLVLVAGAPRALAIAVIRAEGSGTYCYPHGPAHPRLGPFGTPEEALDACREVQRSERCYDSCCRGA